MDSSLAIRETLQGLIRQECAAQGFSRVPMRVMDIMIEAHKGGGDKALASIEPFFAEHKRYQKKLVIKRYEEQAKYIAQVENSSSGGHIDVRKLVMVPLPATYPQGDDGDLALALSGQNGSLELLSGEDIATAISPLLVNSKKLLDHLKSGRKLWLIGQILKNKNNRYVVPIIFWDEKFSYSAELKMRDVFMEGPTPEANLKKCDESSCKIRLEYLPFTPQ